MHYCAQHCSIIFLLYLATIINELNVLLAVFILFEEQRNCAFSLSGFTAVYGIHATPQCLSPFVRSLNTKRPFICYTLPKWSRGGPSKSYAQFVFGILEIYRCFY